MKKVFLLFFACCCTYLTMAETAAIEPLKGDGSKEKPYEIATLGNLRWLSETNAVWNSYFIQTADIDATETLGWNGEYRFSPIGTSQSNFNGHYNGKGHSIIKLYINRNTYIGVNVGLFGYVGVDGNIDSLVLNAAGATIIGHTNTGALVGYNSGTIARCFVSNVSLVGTYTTCGGLVGKNNGIIRNCGITNLVSGNTVVGGFVGENNGIIENCYFKGVVRANLGDLGGFVGTQSSGIITNSYAIGILEEGTSVGGFAGSLSSDDGVTNSYSYFKKSYQTVNFVGSYSPMGTSIPSSCYWETNGNGLNDLYATAYDSTAMKNVSKFTGWKFVGSGRNIWATNPTVNQGRPYLNWQLPWVVVVPYSIKINSTSITLTAKTDSLGESMYCERGFCWSTTNSSPTIDDSHVIVDTTRTTGSFNYNITNIEFNKSYHVRAFARNSSGTAYSEMFTITTPAHRIVAPAGKGTKESPYLIDSLANLFWLSITDSVWNKSRYFQQTANIDATETKGWYNGAGFLPIGTNQTPFNGYYNGGGHQITNLYMNRKRQNLGLFATIYYSSIDSVNLVNCSISNDTSVVGGIVGAAWSSYIRNCFVSGTITGRENVGGVIGSANGDSIMFCSSAVTINGPQSTNFRQIGGLVGYAWGSNIWSSFTKSTVKGSNSTGGFAGILDNCRVIDCYAQGTVAAINGSTYVGGFAGESSSTTTAEHCYSAVMMQLDNVSNPGVFVANDNGSSLTGCFYDNQIVGLSAIDTKGKNTAEMKIQSTFADAGWDFGKVWTMRSTNGYPRLQWEAPVLKVDTIGLATVNSIQLRLVLTNAKNKPIEKLRIYYNTKPDPDIQSDSVFIAYTNTDKSVMTSYNVDLTSLKANTHYYVRAYIVMTDTAYYSASLDFTTLPAKPSIVKIVQPSCSTNTRNVIVGGLPLGQHTVFVGGDTVLTTVSSNTTDTIKGLTSGKTYSFAVQVEGRQSDTTRVKIETQSIPTKIELIGNNYPAICYGDTVKLAVKGANSYQWSIGKDILTSKNDTILLTPTVNSTVTVSNADVCSNSITFYVTVYQIRNSPTIDTIIQPGCNNQASVRFSYLPGSEWTLWSGGKIVLSNQSSTTLTEATIENLKPDTTYYFRVKDAVGCISRDSTIVKIGKSPSISTPPTVAATVYYCQGATATALQATGENLKWYSSDNQSSVLPTVPTPATTNTGTVSYWVSQTEAEKCESNRAKIAVVVRKNPTIYIVNNNTRIALGNSLSLVVNSPQNTQLQWSCKKHFVKGYLNDSVSANLLYNPMVADSATYTVVGTDTNGCTGWASIVLQTMQDSIVAKQEIARSLYLDSASQNIRFDELFTYKGTQTVRYTASSTSAMVASAVINANNISLVTMSAGTATITITATTSLASVASATISVTVVSKITTGCKLSVKDSIVNATCNGQKNGEIHLQASGGANIQYRWITSARSGDLYNLAAGTYSVIIRDSAGCVLIKDYTVEQPDSLKTQYTITPSHCGQADGAVSLRVIGGTEPYQYSWSNSNTQADITSVAAGSYQVTVTDANKCQQTQMISLNDESMNTISTKTTQASACNAADGSIELSGSDFSNSSFLWSDGSTEGNRTQLMAGSYTVTITDKTTDCKAMATATIEVPALTQPRIALVTVDSTGGENLIVWQKEDSKAIKQYTVYRESGKGKYDIVVGSRLYADTSIVVDHNSADQDRVYRYRMSYTDQCGQESPLSEPHRTMLLQVSTFNGVNQLNWDAYEGLDYANFIIYRRSASGLFSTEISASDTRWNDKKAPKERCEYYVAIKLPDSINVFKTKSDSGPFSQSLSNMSEANLVDMQQIRSNNELVITMEPNPTKDVVTIKYGDLQSATVSICNLLGDQLFTSYGVGSVQINCSGYAAGVYLVTIKTTTTTTTRRLIIE